MPEVSSDEWLVLLPHLQTHRIAPLIYWKFAHCPAALHPPEPVASHLRKTFLLGQVRIFRIERQLFEITEAFNRWGIPFLVLRGPALAWSVYPDTAIRPFSDLDLLVDPRNYKKARETLHRLGYKERFKRFEDFKDFDCEETFLHVSGSIKYSVVDLHWELHRFFGNQRSSKFEELYSRSIEIKVNEFIFHTLHPFDALIQASLHMFLTHIRELRLIWVYDVARIARELKTLKDWELLNETSQTQGAQLSLTHSLKLAHLWTGLSLPNLFNNFSSTEKSIKSEKRALNRALFRDEGPIRRLKLYFSSSSTSSLPDKLNLLFKLIFPSAAYVNYSYPVRHPWLLPWSYFRRCWVWSMKLFFHRKKKPS